MICRFSPQTASRILALMLTVVLMLVMMVPAVFADEMPFCITPLYFYFDTLWDSGTLFVTMFPGQTINEGDQFYFVFDDFSGIYDVISVSHTSSNIYYLGNPCIGNYFINADIFPSDNNDLPFFVCFEETIDGLSASFLYLTDYGPAEISTEVFFGFNYLGSSSSNSEPGAEQLAVVTPLLNAITSVISWEGVVGIVVGILGVCVLLAFSWWAVRKGVRLLINAFRRGKISV